MFTKKRLDFGCALWGDDEVDYSYGNRHDLSLFFEYLICHKGVKRFYFTNFNRFNKFCWEIITELKAEYPIIKRVWVVRYYAHNIFTDDYPQGYSCVDFDYKQYVKIEDVESSRMENVGVCRAIMDLSMFNVFCINPTPTRRKKKLTLSRFAYLVCRDLYKNRAIYNVYVQRKYRKYQPMCWYFFCAYIIL